MFIHHNDHSCVYININLFKGAFSGLRQFLAAESPLKMMKNAFYFTSKALKVFVLTIRSCSKMA